MSLLRRWFGCFECGSFRKSSILDGLCPRCYVAPIERAIRDQRCLLERGRQLASERDPHTDG